MSVQLPNGRFPSAIGSVSEKPMSEPLTWAGMSSSPSSVCVQAKSAGTAALAHVSKSRRTSGEAFSLSVSDADVCWMSRCSRPTRRPPISGSAPSTSRVTRWKPRGRGSSVSSRWAHIAHLRRPQPVVVADRVVDAEEELEPAAVGAALGRADLALVGVEHHVGLAVRADRDEAHRLRAVVDELVRPGLAGREAHRLAAVQAPPPAGPAQRGAALQDDEHLLLGEVEV